ncbi:hypothetical protein DPMN_073364 [Dreissena polymorpha]|uniref:Uncharacterized protein n=1 Tax=Dreissena polymorpha TaxID=45954 RepID=A0A9D4BZ34_DREPO|nr:hypothetical protein DPMN_073364 [Dreissena polymorpha]
MPEDHHVDARDAESKLCTRHFYVVLLGPEIFLYSELKVFSKLSDNSLFVVLILFAPD